MERIQKTKERLKEAWHRFIELLKRFQVPLPWRHELWGLLALSSSLLFALALCSFNKKDNALAISDSYNNLLGPVGNFLAWKLLYGIGIFAILVPLALAYFSFRLFFRDGLILPLQKSLGLILTTIFLMPLFYAVETMPLGGSFLISGHFGFALHNFLTLYFSKIGLWLISFTVMLGGGLLFLGRPYLADSFLGLYAYARSLKLRMPEEIEKNDHLVVLPPIEKSAPPLQEPIRVLEPHMTNPPLEYTVHPPPRHESDIQIIERDRKTSIQEIRNAKAHEAKKESEFVLPPLNLLDYDAPNLVSIDPKTLKSQAEKLTRAFLQFGIEGKIREIRPGPVVTNYEFVPVPGIKLSRIAALSDDIAMAMSAVQVRIVTPIPGKGAVGIEVPNETRETVYLKEIVADERYRKEPHKLCMAIGKDVEGNPFYMNLADMPHVLISGTTGSGKSVSVNAMICSILCRATPRDVRFLMIDPKMLELSIYNGIPHLLLPPIIDSKKAANALRWAVKEMDQRYNLMKEAAVRDITSYNDRIKSQGTLAFKPVDGRFHEHLPYIVIVVDEYADLLAIAGKDVEGYIMRLAQKARACGIHVMLATQRPSVDVITGVIKANFPVRMGFRLASSHDSKTIINRTGAEKLLGKGDVLIMPPGTSDLIRIHGAYISEKELIRVVDFLKAQTPPIYKDEIAYFDDVTDGGGGNTQMADEDEKFNEALDIVKTYHKCSTSFLQRHLSVGYNRAARIVEMMEKKGLVGPVQNARGDREIFMEAAASHQAEGLAGGQ